MFQTRTRLASLEKQYAAVQESAAVKAKDLEVKKRQLADAQRNVQRMKREVMSTVKGRLGATLETADPHVEAMRALEVKQLYGGT